MPRSSRSSAGSSPEATRSPRAIRAHRSDLSGLDLNEDDGDEEYKIDDNVDVKDELAEEDDDVEDEDTSIVRHRSRKRKATTNDEDDDDEEDDDEEAEEEEEDADEDAEDEPNENAEEEDGEDMKVKQEVKRQPLKEEPRKPKKRGRKKLNITILEDGVYDEDGNPLNVKNDEVVIDHEDPKGHTKIDENGVLQGGRQFRMKTFKLLGHGDQLFMVSTEPARLVGFRDSYLLFKTHRSLFKKVCTNEEKMDLIDRAIIPNSYKGRSVNLVAARSIFREFGAKMIIDGKKVIDDFWEQRAIERGDIAGEYADPLQYFGPVGKVGSVLGDSNTNGGSTPITSTPLVNYQTDPTWMYQIAVKTREHNNKLQEQRNQSFNRGAKDIFTNSTFYPESTQPTSVKYGVYKEEKKPSSLTYDIKFVNPNIKKRATGLKNVPKDIFNDIDDEEIKRAIIAQQEYEKSIV